jgi:uncharacterized protein (TIGR02611 family)
VQVDAARDEPEAESEQKSDWAWRARIRANPKSRAVYRLLVAVVGTVVTLVGIVLIPAPGPGWLVVFLGLAVLASEFPWAARLLRFARREVGRWTYWAARQNLLVRALLGLVSLAALVGLLWVTLRLSGVPGFVPDRWVPAWTDLHR